MNKHELKSLLENIYTALTEAEYSPHMTPEGPDGESIPWDYRPTPPKPNPLQPYYIPDPNENPWEPDESPLDLQMLRRLLRMQGYSESEIEQIVN